MYIKCDNCQQIDAMGYRAGFTTANDFHDALTMLAQLETTERLSYLGDYIYRCHQCQAHWDLSVPDQAYRGYLRRTSLTTQKIEQRLSAMRPTK